MHRDDETPNWCLQKSEVIQPFVIQLQRRAVIQKYLIFNSWFTTSPWQKKQLFSKIISFFKKSRARVCVFQFNLLPCLNQDIPPPPPKKKVCEQETAAGWRRLCARGNTKTPVAITLRSPSGETRWFVCSDTSGYHSQFIPLLFSCRGGPAPAGPPGEGHFTADEDYGADVTKATCKEGKHRGVGESRGFEGLTYSDKTPVQYF